MAGLWLIWSQYASLAGLSWGYGSTDPRVAVPSTPDYDVTTLPWQIVHPRLFNVGQGRLTLATSSEPYAYEAFATIATNGANTARIIFDAEVERGAVSIGLLQAGNWISVNSSENTGAFSAINSARLGYRRSLTVMIANKNPAGESRVTITSLRLYLRK